MIIRCYPNVSAILPNLVSCAFSTIPIVPPFNSQNFFFRLDTGSEVNLETRGPGSVPSVARALRWPEGRSV